MPVLGRNFEAAEEGDRTEALALLVNARCMMAVLVDVEVSEQRRPERGTGVSISRVPGADARRFLGKREGRRSPRLKIWMDGKLQKKLSASPKSRA